MSGAVSIDSDEVPDENVVDETEEENVKTVYLCSECSLGVDTTHEMVEHMTTRHRNLPRIRYLLQLREKRLRNRQPPKRIYRRLSVFHCSECPYKSKYKTTFLRHVDWHKEDLKECPHCQFQTIQLNNLRVHIRKCHPDAQVP